MEQMTSRQRVLAALNREETDRVPFCWGFGFNDPLPERIGALLGISDREQVKQMLARAEDIARIFPRYIGPSDRNVRKDGIYTDDWGRQSRFVSFGEGGYDETVCSPLADAETVEEIDAYPYPDPDWYDYDSINDEIDRANANGEKAIRFGNVNPFEQASWLRGFETILMDTAAEPELVHAMMRRTTDFYLEYLRRALEAAKGRIDIVFTADDLGGQTGLLLSPESIREFILPYHREINDLVHSYGAKVMYHSCGSCIRAVDMLIECGVDVLESLQFYTADMTPEALKDGFGDRIGFHGGISVQKTLVTGTPDDVRREVEHLTRVLGKGGGFILAPAHMVQAGTPPENILAAAEAAGRLRDMGL